MNNTSTNGRIYEFEGFRFDTGEHELWRDTEKVDLTPKAAELLTILVERRGHTVTRNEILDELWRDTYVDESNLTVTVSMLRKALSVKGNDRRFVETIPKRGYRFNADVRTVDELIVERQTLTHIKIKESEAVTKLDQVSSAPRRSRRNSFAAAAAVGLTLLVGGIFFWGSGYRISGFAFTNGQTRQTIAVLPFAYGKKLGAAGAASDLTASVTDQLDANFQVITSSSMQAEGATIDNFLIVGRRLKADTVFTGVFFEDPTEIYLRVHLVSTGDGKVLWANTYRVPQADAPKLSVDIAQNVADSLRRNTTSDTDRERSTRYAPSAEADSLYLQGRFIWNNRGDVFGNEMVSKKHFEDALRLDPNYALPLIGLADWQKTKSHDSGEVRQAEENLRRALELAPDSADAHATLGFIRMIHHWDWRSAESEFQTALQIDPTCVSALQWYALLLALETRHAEATDKIGLASRNAPFSVPVKNDSAEIAYLQGYHKYAVERATVANFDVPHSEGRVFGRALWMIGEHKRAVEIFSDGSDDNVKEEQFAAALEAEGASGVARLMLERYGRDKKFDLWSSYWQAEWFAYLNENEKALDMLERAADEHHFFIIWAKASPFFANLHGEPRFKSLLTKLNLDLS